MQTMRPGDWVDTAQGPVGLRLRPSTRCRSPPTATRPATTPTASATRSGCGCGRSSAASTSSPRSGTGRSTSIYDQSYIIVRGKDGVLRGFVNACRHRGNLLCKDACGNTGHGSCAPTTSGRTTSMVASRSVPPGSRRAHRHRRPRPAAGVGRALRRLHLPQPRSRRRAAGGVPRRRDGELLEPYHLDEMTTVLERPREPSTATGRSSSTPSRRATTSRASIPSCSRSS